MVRDQANQNVQALWPAVPYFSARVQMLVCNDVEDWGRQLSSPLHVSQVSEHMQISDVPSSTLLKLVVCLSWYTSVS